MDLKKLIRRHFVKKVNAMEMPADVKSGVLSHERKEKFLTNVEKQIMEVRKKRLALGRRPLEDPEYIWMIESMTEMFVGASTMLFEERAKSEAEKTRLKREADEIKDLENTLAGKPTGDYADIVKAVGDGDATTKVEVTDAD